MITGFPSPIIMVAIMIVFLIAGTIKGSLGVGFPAFAMSVFPIFIDSSFGVAILAIPILLTNFMQFFTVKGWQPIVRRFLLAGSVILVTTFIVAQLAADVPSRWINIIVGLSLTLFALSSLFKLNIPAKESPHWQIGVGIVSGVIGGIAAVTAPVMVYAVALKMPREEFMAAAGFMFFTSGVGLVAGLSTASVLNNVTLSLSICAVFVSLAGFRIGAWIRPKLSERVFRTALLWTILALGLRLTLVNIL
ncbi:hypothetical protein SAMN05444287_0454 [Octadecabacter temperatus]|jgi:uncharacterized membrane protein YfcA|uniref:Probable membrane transporter protein n=1 Tax=Octadecabacter temperatus TaxID=1458307 RepID=A0A0K0Y3B9_9RHOB|nr:sulfite exporter TauE/SafE family protein [Octadecabacter temperatus]AKS45362.1 Sulfite exporter TauE/SafE [Octadecabacter temperatus]SIN91314.1 hypothetical protein SAMN05444287_0454 [Octadecabacter temperatus]